jgi:hypothetical protein
MTSVGSHGGSLLLIVMKVMACHLLSCYLSICCSGDFCAIHKYNWLDHEVLRGLLFFSLDSATILQGQRRSIMLMNLM